MTDKMTDIRDLPNETGIFYMINLVNAKRYIRGAYNIKNKCKYILYNLYIEERSTPINDFEKYKKSDYIFRVLELTSRHNLRKKENRYLQKHEPEYNSTYKSKRHLRDITVINIMQDLIKTNESYKEIANKYDLSTGTVRRIAHGKTYKGITGFGKSTQPSETQVIKIIKQLLTTNKRAYTIAKKFKTKISTIKQIEAGIKYTNFTGGRLTNKQPPEVKK